MAAFDLNSLYFLKNAAPKTTSFEEAAAPIKTGFDLGTAYNENYNRNSLQNLIAQRESEGVPFDRLSNEAAKYDLNAANAMRGERRASLDYNYKQDMAEFENWRKNMARRICGLILQKSDELGMAPDQQYGVLDTAAHYVVTYDPELAEFLMQQANTRRYNAARTAPKDKPVTDHEKEISSVMEMMAKPTADAESDPNAYVFRTKLKERAQRLLQWKNANPYDPVRNPDGRLIYKRMLSVLDGMDPKKLTDEQITALVMNTPQDDSYGDDIQNFLDSESNKNNGTATVVPNKVVGSIKKASVPTTETKDTEPTLRPISKPSSTGSGAKVVDAKALGELSDYVEELDPEDSDFKEKYKKAKNVAAKGAEIKDMDTRQSLNMVISSLDSKKKEYDAYIKELKSLGISDPENAFRKFKNLFGTRASLGTVIQLRNFNAFLNSYVSNSPLTAISNGLLVGTPNYKPTLAEINAAKNVHGDWKQAAQTIAMNFKVPFASQAASYANEYPALQALGQDVEKQGRDIWRSVSKELPKDKYDELKKLYTQLFRIGPEAWRVLENENVHLPKGKEYDRQLALMNKESNKGETVNLSGIENGSSSGNENTPSNEGTIDEEKFRRIFEQMNGGNN